VVPVEGGGMSVAVRWITDVSGKVMPTFWHRMETEGMTRCGKAVPPGHSVQANEALVPEEERCRKCVWREAAA
jgi:hypothetical protein